MLPAWKTSVQATQIKSCFLTASTCHCLAWHFVTCFQRWWKFYSTLLETATKFTSAGLRYCWDVGRRGFKPKEVFCLISVFLIISRFIFFYHLWQEISLGTAVSFGLHLSRSWQPEWLNSFLYFYSHRRVGSSILLETHFPKACFSSVQKSHRVIV